MNAINAIILVIQPLYRGFDVLKGPSWGSGQVLG